jgi:hypothetical protein
LLNSKNDLAMWKSVKFSFVYQTWKTGTRWFMDEIDSVKISFVFRIVFRNINWMGEWGIHSERSKLLLFLIWKMQSIIFFIFALPIFFLIPKIRCYNSTHTFYFRGPQHLPRQSDLRTILCIDERLKCEPSTEEAPCLLFSGCNFPCQFSSCQKTTVHVGFCIKFSCETWLVI